MESHMILPKKLKTICAKNLSLTREKLNRELLHHGATGSKFFKQKNKTLKKTIQFFIVAIAVLLLSSFTPKTKQSKDPVYYVCNARELPQPGVNELKYTVSNVVYVDCKN